MNIVFISKLYPTRAGSSEVEITHALHNLVKYWNRTERVVVVRPVYIYLREIFTKKPRLTEKIVYIDDVEVIVFPIFKIPKITYCYYPLYRYLDRFLKKSGIKPDMVVAHYDKSLHIGHRYSQQRNLPFVVGLHAAPDLLPEDPGVFKKRCGRVLDDAAAVACRSLFIYNKICRWFPQHEHKCFTAFSGIENHLILQKELTINKLNQWKNQGKVSILTVSGLIEVKKIDITLEALSRLGSEIDWTYTIIGDGEKRQQLEKLVLQLGISDRVRFKGALPRQKVIEEMECSHIFVLVSILESFGLVYLEAMATGNIVIASKGEGIDGVIRDEKNGFLCPPEQPESLARELEKIILHIPKSTLESILTEAHRTISRYTEEAAAQNYLEKLHNLLNKKKQ
jgi:glycosyltransferase involved in cell wall biosynthesis